MIFLFRRVELISIYQWLCPRSHEECRWVWRLSFVLLYRELIVFITLLFPAECIFIWHTRKITLDCFFNWGRLGLNVNWLRSHAVSYQSTRTNHIMKSCLGSNESSSAFCQVSVLSYEVFLYRGFLFLGGYVHAAATGRRWDCPHKWENCQGNAASRSTKPFITDQSTESGFYLCNYTVLFFSNSSFIKPE